MTFTNKVNVNYNIRYWYKYIQKEEHINNKSNTLKYVIIIFINK